MNTTYVAIQDTDHEYKEECQWADILATNSSAAGMLLLYIQKLCTAFHEFEPAWKAGALNEHATTFVRERLAQRIDTVLAVARANGLDNLTGLDDLRSIRRTIGEARTLQDVLGQTARLHEVNHVICNNLEKQ